MTTPRNQSQGLPAETIDAGQICIIMPVLNEAAHIEKCIESLLQGPQAEAFRMIIVDGGSTDGTREIVMDLKKKFLQISCLDNKKRIQASAMNIGAQAAGEERTILIRCDCHATYPENYCLDVARSLKKHNCESLVVPMDAVGEGCFQKANAWIVDTPLGSGGSAHRGGCKSGYVDHGHHAAFDRHTFDRLGGYDETFTHNEDAEYDARLANNGGRIYLDASIRLIYYPRSTIASLWRQYFGYGQGRARNIIKHRSKPRLRQLIPVIHCLLFIVSVACMPFSFLGFFWPMFYGGILIAVSVLLVLTKRSLCGLWGGAALGVMHFAWGFGFLKTVLLSRISSTEQEVSV